MHPEDQLRKKWSEIAKFKEKGSDLREILRLSFHPSRKLEELWKKE